MEIQNALALRHYLHANPELSVQERNTSNTIVSYLRKIGVKKIHQGFSHYSVLAEIDSQEPDGYTILFRCELDALPIQESNDFEYCSNKEGVSHKCGHDGHAATMVRFAEKLLSNLPQKGKFLLFFQSAEEIGVGAKAAIESGIFEQFQIDYAFSYHNLPAFSLGRIMSKAGLLTPCVESGIFELVGKTSHAAEPEKGINPAKAIADIINYFDTLNQADKTKNTFFIATPIHIQMGEEAYGTSAAKGCVAYTFRAWRNEYLETIKNQIIANTNHIAAKYSLEIKHRWKESFADNNNNEEAYRAIKETAKQSQFLELEKPFEFGEDFGLFTQKYKGAMFFIGSGEQIPPLHSAEYDFPDELIEIGSDMFMKLANYNF